MTQVRLLALTFILVSTLATGCKKSEPDIPTFDPLDKVQPQEGWKVGRSIAVSKGPDILKAHHVQSIASGLHDVDFKTPPKALIPIEPSCNVKRPDTNTSKYIIIGNGQAKFSLMKRPEPTGLITFDNQTENKLAKSQTTNTKTKGVRTTDVTWQIFHAVFEYANDGYFRHINLKTRLSCSRGRRALQFQFEAWRAYFRYRYLYRK